MLLGQVPQGWKPGVAAAHPLRDSAVVIGHMIICCQCYPQM